MELLSSSDAKRGGHPQELGFFPPLNNVPTKIAFRNRSGYFSLSHVFVPGLTSGVVSIRSRSGN
jgi:hypothetical protein